MWISERNTVNRINKSQIAHFKYCQPTFFLHARIFFLSGKLVAANQLSDDDDLIPILCKQNSQRIKVGLHHIQTMFSNLIPSNLWFTVLKFPNKGLSKWDKIKPVYIYENVWQAISSCERTTETCQKEDFQDEIATGVHNGTCYDGYHSQAQVLYSLHATKQAETP